MYCKVCGSCETVPVTIRQEYNSGKTFKPMIGTSEVSASLGSINTTATKSITYSAVLCHICRNIANDESLGANPLKIIMSDYNRVVIVPYRLATQLLALYDEHEIVHIIRQYRKRFDRIFNKWVKTGNNICKKSHVGQKLSIKTRDIAIDCWVIIDYSGAHYMRLSYGGGKIQCP